MSWLDAARQRLVDLIAGKAGDRDLDEEIAHHLALETARQIQLGYDPAVARNRALARFGNPQHITDATRDERGAQPLEGGMQDLGWAVRSLRKSPGFTALALFTLTLGIGTTTAAFAVLDTVLLRPLPYPQADRLVIIEELKEDKSHLYPSYPNFNDWRTQPHSFEHVASTQSRFMRITGTDGDATRVRALGVSRDFFETLRVQPVLGRAFTADENRLGGAPVLMVSYEFWKAHMGANPRLGTVRAGDEAYQVVGVLPAGFQFMRTYDVYFPHEQGPGTIRSAHYLTVIGRLADGISLQAAQAEMTGLSRRLLATYGNETQATDAIVTPFRDFFVGGYRVMLDLVLAGAAVVLLVACTNLVSAQLARGLTRGREIAVRAALGASRRRLVRQLFAESALLAVIGGVMGSFLGAVLVNTIRLVGSGLVPRLAELSVNARAMAFTAAATGIVAILIGVYPALRMVRGDMAHALRGASRSGGTTVRNAVWHTLVGFEVAMAVILICAAALLVRTLHNILTNDVGFDPHGVVTAALSTGDASTSRLEEIRTELAALPGVKGVAFASQFPLSWGDMSAPLLRPTDPLDHDWPALAGYRAVTANYFDVLRLPIVRGRGFLPIDVVGSIPVAVVTPGIVERLWPGENPIGKQFRSNQDQKTLLTVVGVAKEAPSWTMPRGAQNEVYVPLAQHAEWRRDAIAFLRTDGDASVVAGEVSTHLRTTARDMPVKVERLSDRIAATAASRRFAMLAILTFGAVALLLAAVGIYGVLAYSVTSRRFEIGVRMALGASGAMILRHTLRGAAVMAGTGVAAGVLGALFVTRYLKSLLYGVTPFEPTAYLAGAALLLGAALLGAYVPARRASRVDPLLAIRSEG